MDNIKHKTKKDLLTPKLTDMCFQEYNLSDNKLTIGS